LGAPIFVDGERFGTINFSSPKQSRPFIKQDIELARLFAEWVGHEIARNNDIYALEQAHRKLEIVANTDALTGLANRGCLEKTLLEQMSHCQTYDRPLTVALFDFDHFKSINDTFGHSAGDAALIQFSRLTEQFCRKGDFYGRWGGEEFLALFPNANIQETTTVLERLNKQLAETGVQYQGELIHLTTSVGVTLLRKDDDLDALLKRVDMLLYMAKENGRNRIEADE
jgi:diguanylate cyclase (GGDEF)-like protein